MSPRLPAESKRTVLITGVCGGVGRVLLRDLLAHTRHPIVGLDKRNWVLDRPDRFDFRRVDLRRGTAEDVIRTVKPWAVVHLAFVSDQTVSRDRRHEINVQGSQRVLTWSQHYGVQKVVVLSRAAVYGARPDNPSRITEDMPLRLSADHAELSDLVEFDHLCRSFMWEHRDMEVVLLRPVHIVGPNIREGLIYRFLQSDPVLTALGFDPMLQLIHEEDVIQAIRLGLKPDARGIYNVDGPGALPLSALLRAVGRRAIPVPHPLLPFVDRLAFAAGLSRLPPYAIDFLRFGCVVEGQRIRDELGYRNAWDLRQTLAAVSAEGAIVE